jgi:hypothetical protein
VLNTVAGLVLLGLLGFCVARYATVGSRVRSACAQIKPGMNMPDVTAIGESKWLKVYPIREDISFVVAPETMGELGCRIDWSGGVVVTSRYDGPPDEP